LSTATNLLGSKEVGSYAVKFGMKLLFYVRDWLLRENPVLSLFSETN
jgi:hypothetical protein